MQIYFPTVYDIKYLMKFCDNLHGGLNKLAEVLQVERIGPQHQVLGNEEAVHCVTGKATYKVIIKSHDMQIVSFDKFPGLLTIFVCLLPYIALAGSM